MVQWPILSFYRKAPITLLLLQLQPAAELSYFDTFSQKDTVDVSSLDGAVTIKASSDGTDEGSLYDWYSNILDSAATSPMVSKFRRRIPG